MPSPLSPDPLNPPLQVLRAPVSAGETAALPWRREQLQRLGRLLTAARSLLPLALEQDLGRPEAEALIELLSVRGELRLAQRQLGRWASPRSVGVPYWMVPARARVQPQPLGCVLILAPWNYPFQLCLQPLVSALAAGNTAVLKPSAQAPATSALIAGLIREQFPPDIVQVVEGDGGLAARLLEQRFDHVFFTGSRRIGKEVMAAAARQLTPVTLELGGACPALVLEGAHLPTTARRLAWGRTINAGQTCVAPNHVLVESHLQEELVRELKASLRNFHGDAPLQSPDLGRLINQAQFQRLEGLLQQARQRGAILHGGRSDAATRRIEPTLIAASGPEDPLLEEELFGPVLPILGIADLDSALELLNRQAAPLALYLFGGSAATAEQVRRRSRSGSLVRNDVVLQLGVPALPFGGVGESGIGLSHGREGFLTFSHQRSLLWRPFQLDAFFRYPPYRANLPLLRRLFG